VESAVPADETPAQSWLAEMLQGTRSFFASLAAAPRVSDRPWAGVGLDAIWAEALLPVHFVHQTDHRCCSDLPN
jgi:hypothetical protein